MNSGRRVLLVAEAANPEWVSVPLVGWSIAKALRNVADVHIVTQVRNREAIERAGLIEGEDFTSIDTETLMKPLWALTGLLRGGDGKGWTIVTAVHSLSYPLFERMVWKKFGKRIKAGEFDIVHRVTPVSLTAPSSLAKRCSRAGVPFVIGPLNGGVPWPKGFEKERREEGEWLAKARSLYKLMPGIRSTWRNAAAIVTASLRTQSELPSYAREKSVFIPENAVDPSRFAAPSTPMRYDHVDLCFIGRLVPCKGLDVALEAAQDLIRNGKVRLTIIGDGPMMAPLKSLAAELGIAQQVEFKGWVEHGNIPGIARQSNVFLFPSVREFGGGAVVEAMALGLVPIVVDYGGPAEIVTDDTGFRLPLVSRDSLVATMRTLLIELSEGRYDLATLAAKGLERVRALYTWDEKALQLCAVYDWASGKLAKRPEFPFFTASKRPPRGSPNRALKTPAAAKDATQIEAS